MSLKKNCRILLICVLLLFSLVACKTDTTLNIPEPYRTTEKSQETPDLGNTSGTQTEVPTSSPAPDAVEKILLNMSLYDKICQMLIISPESLTGVSQVTAAGNTTKQALERMPVGGLLYSKPNFISKTQVLEMLTNIQKYSKIPLILACDEEGGRVNRLMNTVGTTYIGPMLNYKNQGSEVAYNNAFTIASDMSSLGLNFNMAPVADVWSNPSNTVIGDRAYSDNFQQAASLVSWAVAGFHEGGVGTALKHFPGHGDTSADSHYGAVYVSKNLNEIRSAELLPFKAGIDAGSDMVMMGHLILPDVDTEPALFSYKIVTELLREELGFAGVVITDSLQMSAITDYFSSGEVACKAVLAGVDILLCPENTQETISALQKAVEDGTISEERINESVRRILTAKINRGIIKI